MDVGDLKDWASAVATLLAIGSIVYTWVTSRSKNNSEKLEAIEEELRTHERQIDNLESEFKHLPDKEGQHRLELAMKEMAGEVNTMIETQRITRRTIERIEVSLSGKDH